MAEGRSIPKGIESWRLRAEHVRCEEPGSIPKGIESLYWETLPRILYEVASQKELKVLSAPVLTPSTRVASQKELKAEDCHQPTTAAVPLVASQKELKAASPSMLPCSSSSR